MKIFYYLITNDVCQDWYSKGYLDGVKSHIMKFLVVSLSTLLLVLVISIILSYLENRKSKNIRKEGLYEND